MLKLTKHQYASLVRSLEKTLKSLKKHGEQKGGGPDDYGFPEEMETYLYRHPMSMMEFFVDDNGVRGGGFKTSIGKTLRRIADKTKAFGRRVAGKAKEKAKETLDEAKEKAKEQLAQVSQQAINAAASNVQNVVGRAATGAKAAIADQGGGGRGCAHKQHSGHKQHGCGWPTGSDRGVTGMGLNISGLGFIHAPIMTPAMMGDSVPVGQWNHLQEIDHAPAGGYGGTAFAV